MSEKLCKMCGQRPVHKGLRVIYCMECGSRKKNQARFNALKVKEERDGRYCQSCRTRHSLSAFEIEREGPYGPVFSQVCREKKREPKLEKAAKRISGGRKDGGLTEAEALQRAKAGESSAMEWLVINYKPLFKRVAGEYLRPNVEFADNLSECYLGFHHAVMTYDETRGTRFSTWAILHVRCRVLESIREQIGRYGVKLAICSATSLNQAIRGGESASEGADDTWLDVLPDTTPSVDFMTRDLLIQWFSRLPEREQYAIYLYAHEGLSMSAVGERLGVSEGRACQIINRARERSRTVNEEWMANTKQEAARNTKAAAVLRKAA